MSLGAKRVSIGKSADVAKTHAKGAAMKGSSSSSGAQKLAVSSRAPLVNSASSKVNESAPAKAIKIHIAANGTSGSAPVRPAPVAIDPKFEPFRVLLEAKRAELAGSLGDTRFGTQGHNGRIAEEDQASVSHEEFISSKRNNMEARMLRLVNAALGRIARGEYGDCHACEEEISEKRLKAVPWALFCVKCQDTHANDEPDISEAATPAGAAAVVQAWNW